MSVAFIYCYSIVVIHYRYEIIHIFHNTILNQKIYKCSYFYEKLVFTMSKEKEKKPKKLTININEEEDLLEGTLGVHWYRIAPSTVKSTATGKYVEDKKLPYKFLLAIGSNKILNLSFQETLNLYKVITENKSVFNKFLQDERAKVKSDDGFE